jgi:hypothetical protein
MNEHARCEQVGADLRDHAVILAGRRESEPNCLNDAASLCNVSKFEHFSG